MNLKDTLDCGQAFRWRALSDGRWQGVAHGRIITVSLCGSRLTFYDCTKEEYHKIWRHYFDLERDYKTIDQMCQSDPTLQKICRSGRGIRVLNQEPFETLCSFILSQNNNIKRIKGIVERFCEQFGEPLGGGFYTFPKPEALKGVKPQELTPLRAGFRAKYLIDAAEKVNSGAIDFEKIQKMSIEKAAEALMQIYGVGQKVADCTLLFGLGFAEAFPKDVWIKRAVPKLLPQGLPAALVPSGGIIQQYIFNYARTNELNLEKPTDLTP